MRTPSEVEEDLRLWSGTVNIGVPVEVITEPSPNFNAEDLVADQSGYRQRLTQNASLDVATFYNDYTKLETLSLGPGFLISARPSCSACPSPSPT